MTLFGKAQDFLDFLETWVRRVGAIVAIVIAFGVVCWPFGNMLNLISAWRFGAHGAIRYDLGDRFTADGKLIERALTDDYGQLYLLRSGSREYADIGVGDVVQAKSAINFRDYSADICLQGNNCGKAPIVFVLNRGDCAIVIGKLHAEDGGDLTMRDGSDKITGYVKNRKGGWLHVATSACGLFK